MTTSECESSDRTVLIIGGGIGGLSAAIALQDVGYDVEVYEQAQELREVGAGLTLWRNGLEALDVLGGHEAAVQAGATFQAAEFRTPDGGLLLRVDLDSLDLPPTDADVPNLMALHRAELQRILRDRVGNGVVHLDHECVGVEQDGGQVTAQFASGKELSGDLLVGADGIHSVVRSSLHGEEEPRFSGVGLWRAVTRIDHPISTSDTTFQSIGRKQRFFAIPIGDGRVYWGVSKRVQEDSDRHTANSKKRLATSFDEWHEPVPTLIDSTPEEALIWDEAEDRTLLDEWGRGNISLLGDAAHLALPFMGQGACQAMEDAVWLARHLDRHSEPAAALRAYEDHRKDRTASIVRSSRRNGRIFHLNNPVLVAVRNLIYKYGPTSMLKRILEQNLTTEL